MSNRMFETLLVANRGEIAHRVIRTARGLGIRTVAVYSEADAELPYVAAADESVLLGPAQPAESYLSVEKILDAARRTGAQAVHPGYGFLAESPVLARQVAEAGMTWVGPAPETMERVADKINARNLMLEAGVPVAAGSRDSAATADEAIALAEAIGYPVMVKPSGGGGGIGMALAHDPEQLREVYDTARSRAERFFGDARILIERYIPDARHVEVQILGLADGRVVALGERDCSVQRRNQKVVEESPSPGLSPQLRERMLEGAVQAGKAIGYRNAGTVECLVDPARQEYVFLEVNARIPVEHPVTEAVFGVDLVEAQLWIAAGLPVQFDPGELAPRGHAIELRVYAEDPKRFLPSPGTITTWVEPGGDGIRVDGGYTSGNKVTPFYDPLLAKLVVWGDTRAEALARAQAAAERFVIEGPKTNLPFCTELLGHDDFRSGTYSTNVVHQMRSAARAGA